MQELTITFNNNLSDLIIEKLQKERKIKEVSLNKDTITLKYLKEKKLYKKLENNIDDILVLKEFDKHLDNLKTYYIDIDFNCEVCLSKKLLQLFYIEGISYASYNKPTLTIKYIENKITIEEIKTLFEELN